MGKSIPSTNKRDYEKAEQKIRDVLADGQWHRARELEQKTQLSPSTLSKHLKRNLKITVERKVDYKGREYPRPVYYRLNLTIKGRQRLLAEATDQITKGLRNILVLDTVPPQKREEWREAARQAFLHAETAEDRIRKSQEVYEAHWGLLAKAYRTIHNLVCELAFPQTADKPAYLGFTSTGDLNMVPAEILKDLMKKAGEDFLV
jgi:DNA-binding transcriptional ArsR family regulator